MFSQENKPPTREEIYSFAQSANPKTLLDLTISARKLLLTYQRALEQMKNSRALDNVVNQSFSEARDFLVMKELAGISNHCLAILLADYCDQCNDILEQMLLIKTTYL